ncbi:MAG: hypothetical protein JRG83_04870 [Deltaproteobacteria bacterium]|nr:hypothetical protein [Deltaproteobacteria bacterium]
MSTPNYERNLEELPEDQAQRSISKSSVSRRFVALSRRQMTGWLSAPLAARDIRVLVIDGIVFRDYKVWIRIARGFSSSCKRRMP